MQNGDEEEKVGEAGGGWGVCVQNEMSVENENHPAPAPPRARVAPPVGHKGNKGQGTEGGDRHQ